MVSENPPKERGMQKAKPAVFSDLSMLATDYLGSLSVPLHSSYQNTLDCSQTQGPLPTEGC